MKWLGLLVVLVMMGCSPEHTVLSRSSILDSPKDDQAETALLEPNYDSLREHLFKKYCLDCHDSSGIFSNHDFSTYTALVGYIKLFIVADGEVDTPFVKALVSGAMPKKQPKLSDEQISVVREWVHLGLPEKAPEVDYPPITNYQDFKTEVFDKRCVRCHASFAKFPLADYTQVIQSLNKIRMSLEADKMPPKIPLDSKLKIRVIEWIDAGAPEF